MDQDQSLALAELAKNVQELNHMIIQGNWSREQTFRAYEVVLSLRANANLVKAYVLDCLEKEELAA